MKRKSLGKQPTSKYVAPALEKGLDILECLAKERVPLTQVQICRLLGKGPSQIYRMLACLERRGYLRKDPVSGGYSLTLRLFELSHTHSPFEPLVRAAARPMQQLTETLRESCHLSVLHGARLLTLAQEESPQRIRISVEVGELYSPLHTVSGRVLLAYLPSETLEQLLESSEEYRALSAPKKAAMARWLDRIRARGFDDTTNESIKGTYDLAVLVGSPHASLRAALAIPALTREASSKARQRLLGPLRDCARAIEGAAGLLVLSGSET